MGRTINIPIARFLAAAIFAALLGSGCRSTATYPAAKVAVVRPEPPVPSLMNLQPEPARLVLPPPEAVAVPAKPVVASPPPPAQGDVLEVEDPELADLQ